MVIYGVALLAGCLLSGLFFGDLLGQLLGVQANVGGVGIAMLLLILAADRLNRRRAFLPATTQGILFWSGIYIPIVVAMAARQNVVAALAGGPAAILAGTLAVAVGLALVPAISRIGAPPDRDQGDPPPA
ncbi:MAG: malonate transporter subunit MadL [Gemmatimonadota bacterium]|jgi:malonate transporter MadL subunit